MGSPLYTEAPPTRPLYVPPPAAPHPPSVPPPAPAASSSRRGVRGVAVVLLCLLSGLAGGAVVRLTTEAPATVATAGPSSTVASGSTVAEPAAPPAAGTVAAVAQSAKPSVVSVLVGNGGGSGVIVSSDGLIITNAHVVDRARVVTVRLADGTELDGTVLGRDADVDVAVVQVDRRELPAARIGSALTLHAGDPVVAVGSPLGLEGSVSAGVVSALGRYVPDSFDSGALRAAIQTDVAINPGNSGGALLDASGRVVGITTAKIGGGNVDNIGFALPIDIAQSIARDLADGRTPSHPYMGISGPEVDAATAQALGGQAGAKILEVGAGTPAARAGLRAGDVITSIDGREIGSVFDLSVVLATHRAGDRLAMGLADARVVTVILEERPS